MKTLTLVLIALLLGACLPPWKVANKDFFECGANNTLVVCPVGETPDAGTHGDCRAVGSGTTTLADGTCS